jgi:hypothetical protein
MHLYPHTRTEGCARLGLTAKEGIRFPAGWASVPQWRFLLEDELDARTFGVTDVDKARLGYSAGSQALICDEARAGGLGLAYGKGQGRNLSPVPPGQWRIAELESKRPNGCRKNGCRAEEGESYLDGPDSLSTGEVYCSRCNSYIRTWDSG